MIDDLLLVLYWFIKYINIYTNMGGWDAKEEKPAADKVKESANRRAQ